MQWGEKGRTGGIGVSWEGKEEKWSKCSWPVQAQMEPPARDERPPK